MIEPTYENALTELKTIHYSGVGAYTDDSFVYELAFEALEKQIKKKVKRQWIKTLGSCPICNTTVTFSGHTNYCDICGQALDWCAWEEEE